MGCTGEFVAIAHFEDQVEQLPEAGLGAASNLCNEAGCGFTGHVRELLEIQQGRGRRA